MSEIVCQQSTCCQASGNFLQYGIGSRFNLRFRLILNRMGDVNGIKVGATKCCRLSAGSSHKFSGRNRHSRDAEGFESG